MTLSAKTLMLPLLLSLTSTVHVMESKHVVTQNVTRHAMTQARFSQTSPTTTGAGYLHKEDHPSLKQSRRPNFPARVLGNEKSVQPVTYVRTVVEGDKGVRLSCLVDASPRPFIMWTKNERSVDVIQLEESSSPRLRLVQRGRSLTLRGKVRMEDAGVYVCLAVNGFGSVRVSIHLNVLPINGIIDLNNTATNVIGRSFLKLTASELQPNHTQQSALNQNRDKVVNSTSTPINAIASNLSVTHTGQNLTGQGHWSAESPGSLITLAIFLSSIVIFIPLITAILTIRHRRLMRSRIVNVTSAAAKESRRRHVSEETTNSMRHLLMTSQPGLQAAVSNDDWLQLLQRRQMTSSSRADSCNYVTLCRDPLRRSASAFWDYRTATTLPVRAGRKLEDVPEWSMTDGRGRKLIMNASSAAYLMTSQYHTTSKSSSWISRNNAAAEQYATQAMIATSRGNRIWNAFSTSQLLKSGQMLPALMPSASHAPVHFDTRSKAEHSCVNVEFCHDWIDHCNFV